MTPKARDLLAQARTLTSTERLCLIDGLFESLEGPDDDPDDGREESDADEQTGIFPMP